MSKSWDTESEPSNFAVISPCAFMLKSASPASVTTSTTLAVKPSTAKLVVPAATATNSKVTSRAPTEVPASVVDRVGVSNLYIRCGDGSEWSERKVEGPARVAKPSSVPLRIKPKFASSMRA